MHKNQTMSEEESSRDKNFQPLNLSQLSISQIKEHKYSQDSVDFQQQSDFISQIIPKIQQSARQYGLQPFSKKSQLNCAKRVKISTNKLQQVYSQNALQKNNRYSPNKKQLCFDHQIKRKKSLKRSKNGRFLRSESSTDLKEITSDTQITIKKSKKLFQKTANIIENKKIQGLEKYFFRGGVMTNLEEKPIKSQFCCQLEQSSKQIYHTRPDDMKKEINDINLNFHFHHFSSQQERPKSHSLGNSVNFQEPIKETNQSSQDFVHKRMKGKSIMIENCYFPQKGNKHHEKGIKQFQKGEAYIIKRNDDNLRNEPKKYHNFPNHKNRNLRTEGREREMSHSDRKRIESLGINYQFSLYGFSKKSY